MILSQSDLLIGHGTHPGETGKNNEDRYEVKAYRAEDGEAITFVIVADGIGGHRAGEVASSLAVETILSVVEQTKDSDYLALLNRAMGEAARVIAERAKSHPDYLGMGTTCAIALVAGRRLYTAYLGDSRIYLMRGGALQQISVDHTWMQAAIEHNLITREEARHHPNRHVVLRHLGDDPDEQPDFRLRLSDDETPEQSKENQGLELGPKDTVLVCSDGLTDVVEDAVIARALAGRAPQAAVDELIHLAREGGGPDNITVIVMRVPG
ncbi:MAG: PPM-type phosphatase protein [Anaerolineales bacterium]|jgi:protein phosphatase|nr:PPM-type phosphatase protein [Anaerolineales bacterium]